MAYLKYAPMATFGLFIAFAIIGYSVTGAGVLLLLGLGTGFVVGSWVAESVEPKRAHVELGKQLKRTRKYLDMEK